MSGPIHRTNGVYWLLAHLLSGMLAALFRLDEALPDMQTYHGCGGSAKGVSMMLEFILSLICLISLVLIMLRFL